MLATYCIFYVTHFLKRHADNCFQDCLVRSLTRCVPNPDIKIPIAQVKVSYKIVFRSKNAYFRPGANRVHGRPLLQLNSCSFSPNLLASIGSASDNVNLIDNNNDAFSDVP
jgi:hypothetical protein